MRTLSFLGFLSAIAFQCGDAWATLLITPTSGTLNVSRWQGVLPKKPSADDIDDITGYGNDGDWKSLYKADQGNPIEESGEFKNSYTTSFFNTPNDPSDADVTYDGGAVMSARFLIVKDGNNNPRWYIFDLHAIGPWDGVMDIQLRDFWPSNGAISHINFIGPTATLTIPEPTSLLCWSVITFGCVLFWNRRKR